MPSSREAVRAIRQRLRRLASQPALGRRPWVIPAAGGAVASDPLRP